MVGSVAATTCNDGLSDMATAGFPDEEATVAGRQLGSIGGTTAQADGTGDIGLDNRLCAGEDRSLVDCMMLDFGGNNCGHNKDIGVSCFYNGQKRMPTRRVDPVWIRMTR
jgi:hypothetical protein